VESIARRSAAEPVKAGLVGVLAQLLFFPVLLLGILVLVLSIVGIPLLVLVPFVLIAGAVVLLVGFTGVARVVGGWLSERLGLAPQSAYAAVWLGLLVILTPTLASEVIDLSGDGGLRLLAISLGLIGLLGEYLAWTTGLGALILNRFSPLPTAPARATAPPPPPITRLDQPGAEPERFTP